MVREALACHMATHRDEFYVGVLIAVKEYVTYLLEL